MLIKEIQKHQELNYHIVGLIDDDAHKADKRVHGIRVLGGRDKIPQVCKQYKIEDIIVAMPSASQKTKKKFMTTARRQNAS
jgi:Predicted nucleoside-diphosphate sugar epimerases